MTFKITVDYGGSYPAEHLDLSNDQAMDGMCAFLRDMLLLPDSGIQRARKRSVNRKRSLITTFAIMPLLLMGAKCSSGSPGDHSIDNPNPPQPRVSHTGIAPPEPGSGWVRGPKVGIGIYIWYKY